MARKRQKKEKRKIAITPTDIHINFKQKKLIEN